MLIKDGWRTNVKSGFPVEIVGRSHGGECSHSRMFCVNGQLQMPGLRVVQGFIGIVGGRMRYFERQQFFAPLVPGLLEKNRRHDGNQIILMGNALQPFGKPGIRIEVLLTCCFQKAHPEFGWR